MKVFTIYPVLLLFVVMGMGCEREPQEVAAMTEIPAGDTEAGNCPLEGSWEMVSMKMTTPDSTVTYDETEQPTLKILNASHWMFIRQSADRFIFAQGGHYTTDGQTYTEIVDYSADPNNIGNAYTFECRVEEDRWYHKGGLGNIQYDEVWRRVARPADAPPLPQPTD